MYSRRLQSSRLGTLNPVFHKREKAEDNVVLTAGMIKQARASGVLNLSGKALSTVPDKVFAINETDPSELSYDINRKSTEEAWWDQVPLTNLDLSSNSLTTVSPQIIKLEDLTILSLHNNNLTSLPNEIGELIKLTRINLSRNKLNDLPDKLCSLPNLRILNLSHNSFEELPPAISDIHMLEQLDVSNNNLKSLPCGIGFLTKLIELKLSYNHLKELPSDITQMWCLQKLDLTHNDLLFLPEDIGLMRKLEFIYLQHNDMRSLPDFESCEELQELYAANNYLKKIPEKFCETQRHLKILDLADNQITVIPDEIGLLHSLTRLNVANNNISKLPYSLAKLGHLVNLQVEGNPIKTIRREILQCGTTRILKTLRDRSISDQAEADTNVLNVQKPNTKYDETVFPDRFKMRKTHSLFATMQNLDDVPAEVLDVAKEENVTMIDLSKNVLQSLPESLLKVNDCLTELVVAKNFLKSVPSFISQFTRLAHINLSNNQLSVLPEEFGVLNTLREVNFCNNHFKSIPNCLYNLPNLEIILMGSNRIQMIDATPQGLGGLKRLATLDLSNNDISHVPPILGNLQNITSLDLIGNSFRQPRHQILAKGTASIMSYLRDRITPETSN
ncbi:leucine-rich repeat-containing protein 40-like [Teleopsis dalmanni]|uniref:leucine-rich repeat-containing protein 40-like n=1 Tax=Teleopsis dalmanni TaxID=139649 RepID=UPI0018CD4646|nr:leucine-rich repeat-containing protein 40-like [Teleopsis dalmanni]